MKVTDVRKKVGKKMHKYTNRNGQKKNGPAADTVADISSNIYMNYENLCRRQYKELKRIFSEAIDPDQGDEQLKLFQIQFRECFRTWKEIKELRDAEDRANIILESYFSNGKMKRELQDFVEYVKEDMESEENVEDLIVAGFNSYMNFARKDYQKMQERLNEIPLPSGRKRTKEEEKEEKINDEEIIDFLRMLAYKNDFFADIHTAYYKCTKRMNGETVVESDKELSAQMRKVIVSIRNYGKKDSPQWFTDASETMRQQKKEIMASISKADDVKTELDKILCDQNMEALKNRETNIESLKKQYSEMSRLISEFLYKF